MTDETIKPKSPHPHEVAYAAWKSEPSQENLGNVLTALQPAVEGTLRGMGSDKDDVIRLKANLLAAKAVKNYDPSYGAALPTWVSQQLQPLRRFKRQLHTPAHVPERVQLDAMHLTRAENEFRDLHNRDPDVEELADHSHLSVSRITNVRRVFRPIASQAAFGDNMPGTASSDYSDEALGYIHKDSDIIDRHIIEMKTGYGGKYDPIPPIEIAKRLNLSPVQLSRRSARIAIKLNEIRNALQNT